MNKTALITGATGGIGSAIAQKLLKTHTSLILLGNKTQLNKRLFPSSKKPIHYAQVDLTDTKAVALFIQKNKKLFSTITTVIHAASPPIQFVSIEKVDTDEFIKHFTVAIPSLVQLIQASLASLKSGSGRIIVITSSLTHNTPSAQLSPYVAAKTALSGLTKSLAVELAKYEITVNSISPGFTDTSYLDTLPSQLKQLVIPKIPLKRFAKPLEIATLVGYLCSKDAQYITGIDIPVAGGLVM